MPPPWLPAGACLPCGGPGGGPAGAGPAAGGGGGAPNGPGGGCCCSCDGGGGTIVTVCGSGESVTVCGGGALGGGSVVGMVTGLRGAAGGTPAPSADAAPIIEATRVPCASQSDRPSPDMM